MGNNSCIEWIDQYKGILIYLVVLGHCIQNIHINMTPISSVTYYSIYAFHMPAFFFISSYLLDFDKMSTNGYLIKKAKRLIVPYFAYSIFVILYKVIGDIEFSMASESIVKSLIMMNGSIVQNLWFFPAMFISYVLLYPMRRFQNIKIIIGETALLMITSILMSVYSIKLPLFAEVGFLGAFFMMTGYIAKIWYDKVRKYKTIIFAVAIISLALSLYSRNLVAFYNLDLGKTSVFFLTSISCSLSLLMILKEIHIKLPLIGEWGVFRANLWNSLGVRFSWSSTSRANRLWSTCSRPN